MIVTYINYICYIIRYIFTKAYNGLIYYKNFNILLFEINCEVSIMDKKIEYEYELVCQMIDLFARKNDTYSTEEIGELKAYVKERLISCKNRPNKPFCSYCKIHCYKPKMRDMIREIMRFSGPRFIFYRPYESIKHLLHKSSFIRNFASKKAYRK